MAESTMRDVEQSTRDAQRSGGDSALEMGLAAGKMCVMRGLVAGVLALVVVGGLSGIPALQNAVFTQGGVSSCRRLYHFGGTPITCAGGMGGGGGVLGRACAMVLYPFWRAENFRIAPSDLKPCGPTKKRGAAA